MDRKSIRFFGERSPGKGREVPHGTLHDGSDTAVARDISFEYGDATTDYGKGSVYVRTRVTAAFVSEIDTESLKDEFLGKGADEIREALGKHPEIRKIEINLKPKFFTFSVPKDKKRVTVRIEEP
jgi:hypothetical protein